MQLTHTLNHPPDTPGLIMPTLMLSQAALDMMATYVNTPKQTEINGFAFVKRAASNVFYVASAADVFITRQTVTIGSAHVDGTAYALAVDRAAEEDRVDELRLQWHSHPGDAYFSPTDLTNIESLGRTSEWLVSLVTNREGDIHARLDVFRPVRIGAEMQVQVFREADGDMQARAQADVERLLTTPGGRQRRRVITRTAAATA